VLFISNRVIIASCVWFHTVTCVGLSLVTVRLKSNHAGWLSYWMGGWIVRYTA